MSYPPSQGGSYLAGQSRPSAPNIEEDQADLRQVEGYGQQQNFLQKQDTAYTPQNISGYSTENPPQYQPPANGYPFQNQPTSIAGHPTQQESGYQRQPVAPPQLTSGYPPQPTPGYPPQSTPGYPPQLTSGYPPQSTSGHPPQPTPGYPPQSTPGYPPQPTSGYLPQSTSGYPPQPTSGHPPQPTSGYPPQSTPGYPPQPTSGYPPQSTSGHPPQPTSGYPPQQITAYTPQTYPPVTVQPSCPASLGSCATSCFCPTCHTIVITRCEYTNSSNSWVTCMILFFTGFCLLLPWFICWIPFCMSSMKTVVHRCPQCGSHLGTYQGGKM